MKVITNDNALSVNRPVQELFPLGVSSNKDVGQNKAKGVEKESEGKAENLEEEKGDNRDNRGLNEEKDEGTNMRDERERMVKSLGEDDVGRRKPRRAAALDAQWRTRVMLDP